MTVSPALILDAVLVVIVLLYAAEGARRGFVRTAMLAVGFVAGGLLGFRLVPDLLGGRLAGLDPALALVALGAVVLVFALVGQALALAVGRALRIGGGRGTGPIDAVFGAVLTGGLALLIAWLGGGLVRVAMPGDVARVVGSSRVLAAVENASPVTSADVLDRAHSVFDAYDFPRVFEGVTAEPITPVDEADPASARSPEIEQAGRSVVRIDATATACGRMQEGSGFVASPGVVVTNAHVVAGASRVVVRKDRLRSTARVIAFDAGRDLAVLGVDTGDLAPLPFAEGDLDTGDPAVVAGFPLGGPFTTEAARVRDRVTARGRDIYGADTVVREVYALRVPIQPGNSGGPVLSPAGETAGVVFAKSLDDDATAYALTLDELRPVLAVAQSGAEVSTGPCAV